MQLPEHESLYVRARTHDSQARVSEPNVIYYRSLYVNAERENIMLLDCNAYPCLN